MGSSARSLHRAPHPLNQDTGATTHPPFIPPFTPPPSQRAVQRSLSGSRLDLLVLPADGGSDVNGVGTLLGGSLPHSYTGGGSARLTELKSSSFDAMPQQARFSSLFGSGSGSGVGAGAVGDGAGLGAVGGGSPAVDCGPGQGFQEHYWGSSDVAAQPVLLAPPGGVSPAPSKMSPPMEYSDTADKPQVCGWERGAGGNSQQSLRVSQQRTGPLVPRARSTTAGPLVPRARSTTATSHHAPPHITTIAVQGGARKGPAC